MVARVCKPIIAITITTLLLGGCVTGKCIRYKQRFNPTKSHYEKYCVEWKDGIKSFSDHFIKKGSSRYVKKEKSIFISENSGLQMIVNIVRRKSGLLPTADRSPAVIELRIYVMNLNSSLLSIRANEFEFVRTDGRVIKPYGGDDWGDGYFWLDPQIIAINGRDVSAANKRSADMLKGDSSEFEVSFPLEKRFSEKEALGFLREIRLNK